MKNIQVIDGALNCTFSIFQATDEEFSLLFPEPGQDIQYAEDLTFASQDEFNAALQRIWERPLRKQDACGIHGTLFYQLERYKKTYREKREDSVDPSAINLAQRRLFGIS
jgi:alkyl sulfatase BDS1-like metallo-beta-lactamase superfamily hydrolase